MKEQPGKKFEKLTEKKPTQVAMARDREIAGGVGGGGAAEAATDIKADMDAAAARAERNTKATEKATDAWLNEQAWSRLQRKLRGGQGGRERNRSEE